MIEHLVTKIINKKNIRSLQSNICNEVKRAMQIQQHFPNDIILPSNYGKAMPERVMELLFVNMSYSPNIQVLDVGHANAMKCHLNILQSLPKPKYITGIDIAKPAYNVHRYYERSIIGSITNTDFSENSFDLIWCISALEHFGMDNSAYTNDFSIQKGMDIFAAEEMLRIVKTGGGVLITVPYGKYENHTSHINYDKHNWQRVLEAVRPKANIREWYFKHTYGQGWIDVNSEELQFTSYYEQANLGAGGLAVVYITKK
jgi:SAM-dependent methyltransferase